jgi:hypothetical protein
MALNQQQPPLKEPIVTNGRLNHVWANYFLRLYSANSGLNDAVDLNTAHRLGDGSDHSDVALNTVHRTSDGSDHTFIDQDVTISSSPTFAGLSITGGMVLSVVEKNNDYTALSTDYCVIIDASSNTVTITLPGAPTTGQVYKISCKDSTNTADVDFNGKTFDGDSGNFALFEDESLEIIYDGTEWRSGG